MTVWEPGQNLVWEEPPKANMGRWQHAVLELKQRPGEYARLLEGATRTTAHNVAHILRGYGCEVATREYRGTASLWARWPSDEYRG